jgi:hypothetical protein
MNTLLAKLSEDISSAANDLAAVENTLGNIGDTALAAVRQARHGTPQAALLRQAVEEYMSLASRISVVSHLLLISQHFNSLSLLADSVSSVNSVVETTERKTP